MLVGLDRPLLQAALAASLIWSAPCLPAVADAGAAIFEAKCVACHVQGGNVLNPGKTLSREALQKNAYTEQASIVNLLRVGKGQMPKYQGSIPPVSRLTDEELEEVASYVLARAADEWK